MGWKPKNLTDGDAIHDNVAGEIAAVTQKTTPVNADLVLIEDSEASNAKKRVQVGNLPGGGGGGGGGDLVRLDEVVLASDQANITFSGISDAHRRLVVVGRLRSDRAAHADGVLIRVGNTTVDGGSNYAYNVHGSQTEDSGGASRFKLPASMPAASADAGIYSFFELQIYSYADTSQFRQAEFRGGGRFSTTANAVNNRGFGNWKNDADTIDIVRILPESGTNIIAGSRLTLYAWA